MADLTRLEQFLNHIAHPEDPIPAPLTRMEQSLLEIAENKDEAALPDYSEASDGDVLSIEDGAPAWKEPSGGGGIVVLPYEIGVSYNELKAIVEGGTLPVIFQSDYDMYYVYILQQLTFADISGEGELQYQAVFGKAGSGEVGDSVIYTSYTPTDPLVTG